MIDGNVLKFGYGDIAVNCNSLIQAITFQQFKPPQECGENIPKDAEYIGDIIILDFSYDEYNKFNQLLQIVQDRNISKFTFKGYEFNFENYNEKSVKVCKKYLQRAMLLYFMAMAC